MIDKLISAGSTFDWITPLWTFYQDWRNRPSAGFAVDAATAWSAFAVRDLLAEYGIRTWGWRITSGLILFRLRAAQAGYAESVMERAGVPWVGSSNYKKHTPKRKRRRPAQPKKRVASKDAPDFWSL